MTTSAPLASARTEEMVVIHRVFRHGFPMIAELVRLTPQGATGRANSIDWLKRRHQSRAGPSGNQRGTARGRQRRER